MRTYEIEIEGVTPLIMHWDNLDWADDMERWQKDPKTQKFSKKGDDRTPAHRWIGSVYHDGKAVSIPQDNLSRCMLEGGSMVPVPGGRSGKTFKAQTQSGLRLPDVFYPILIHGTSVDWKKIAALINEPDFEKHKQAANALGFQLFVKRAKIGASKHVRVRPKFDLWALKFDLDVIDDQITKDALENILKYAGAYKGLGDWRPSSPKSPGPYGTFAVKTMRQTN